VVEYEKDKVYFVTQAENYPLKEHMQMIYLVQMDVVEREYSCVCCSFQKDDILSSHILKVMLYLNVPEIPENYIIDRWRKKDTKQSVKNVLNPHVFEEIPTLRFNMLSKRLVQVAANASMTTKKSTYPLQEMLRVEKVMAEMDNEEQATKPLASTSTRDVTHVPSAGDAENSSTSIHLQNSDVSNTKGRPRMLSIREAIKQNKFYTCSHCGSDEHTNLDKVYNLPRRKRTRTQNTRNQKKGNLQKLILPSVSY
jgi:hypothetical protein